MPPECPRMPRSVPGANTRVFPHVSNLAVCGGKRWHCCCRPPAHPEGLKPDLFEDRWLIFFGDVGQGEGRRDGEFTTINSLSDFRSCHALKLLSPFDSSHSNIQQCGGIFLFQKLN